MRDFDQTERESLHSEANTRVQFTALMLAVSGLMLGLFLQRDYDSRYLHPMAFLILSFMGFLHSSIYYASAAGILSRARLKVTARGHAAMKWGNIMSEYLGIYPLLLALPLLVLNAVPGTPALAWIAFAIDIVLFGVYLPSPFSILNRYLASKRAMYMSVLPLLLLFTTQFAARAFGLPMIASDIAAFLLVAYCVWMTISSTRSSEFFPEYGKSSTQRRTMKPPKLNNGRLHFTCLQEKCQNPCCGPFAGVSGDLESVFGLRPDEIVLTEEDAERIADWSREESDKHVRYTGEHLAIKLTGQRECPFWNDKRCTIYEIRPTLCRAFPLYIDMFTGLNVVNSCPGVGQGWTGPDETQEMLNALADMYEQHLVNKVRKVSIASRVFSPKFGGR